MLSIFVPLRRYFDSADWAKDNETAAKAEAAATSGTPSPAVDEVAELDAPAAERPPPLR